MPGTLIAGVDGCRGGAEQEKGKRTAWLLLLQDLATGILRSVICRNASELLERSAGVAVVAMDIPIGLPDQGRRICDLRAREFLGWPRLNSVFFTPVRQAVDEGAESYRAACDAQRCADSGRALSRQCWNLFARIRDVDQLLTGDPRLQERIREVHPEVSFREWQLQERQERRMLPGKKSGEGRKARQDLIRGCFGKGTFEQVFQALPRGEVAKDDVADAFAALWTARRIYAGQARTLPEHPPLDAHKLRMEIVY